MNVESLISALKGIEYKSDHSNYNFPVISNSHFDLVERAVRLWASRQDEEKEQRELATKLGRAEAMCNVYEAVLRHSNFSPVVEAIKGEDDEV